jgi:hypothetical protein
VRIESEDYQVPEWLEGELIADQLILDDKVRQNRVFWRDADRWHEQFGKGVFVIDRRITPNVTAIFLTQKYVKIEAQLIPELSIVVGRVKIYNPEEQVVVMVKGRRTANCYTVDRNEPKFYG